MSPSQPAVKDASIIFDMLEPQKNSVGKLLGVVLRYMSPGTSQAGRWVAPLCSILGHAYRVKGKG